MQLSSPLNNANTSSTTSLPKMQLFTQASPPALHASLHSTATPTETYRCHSSRQRNFSRKWLETSSQSGRKRANSTAHSTHSTTSSVTKDVAQLPRTTTQTTAIHSVTQHRSSSHRARQVTWHLFATQQHPQQNG